MPEAVLRAAEVMVYERPGPSEIHTGCGNTWVNALRGVLWCDDVQHMTEPQREGQRRKRAETGSEELARRRVILMGSGESKVA